MPSQNSNARIRQITETFVEELEAAIREAAMESVREALTGSGLGAPAAPRKRRTSATKKGTKRAPTSGGRRGKRSTADVEKVGAQALAFVKKNPGSGATDIREALGLAAKDLRLPILRLVETKALRTKGQKRGTKYFAKG